MLTMQCISVSKLPEVPIGTILTWVPEVDHNGGEFASLPDGWIRCDGSMIPSANGSIWAGKMVPDLNGERRFLRGGSDNDVLTMEEAQMESHDHSVSASAHVTDPGHSHSYQYESGHLWEGDNANDRDMITSMDTVNFDTLSSKTGISVDISVDVGSVHGASSGSETRPKNMNVIYILRVW